MSGGPIDMTRPATSRRAGREGGLALLIVSGTVILIGAAAFVGEITAEDQRRQRQERVVTVRRIDRVEQALLQYVERTGALPCPARGDQALQSAAGGDALPLAVNGRACDYAGASVDASVGVVPWRTLGLDPEDALDEWGRRISYRVYDGDPAGTPVYDGSLVQANGMNFAACLALMDGELTQQALDASSCSQMDLADLQSMETAMADMFNDVDGDPSNGLTGVDPTLGPTDPNYDVIGIGAVVGFFQNHALHDIGATVVIDTQDPAGTWVDDYTPGEPGRGAGVILISHGENGRGAWTRQGQAFVAATSSDEVENADADSGIPSFIDPGFQGIEGTNSFDDIVQARSVYDLAANAGLFPDSTGFDPDNPSSSCAEVFPVMLCNLVLFNNNGGDLDIIAQNEDFSDFNKGGTGTEEISFSTASDGTQILNFGNPIDEDGDVVDIDPDIGDTIELSTERSACVFINQALRFREETIRAFWEFRVYGDTDDSADGYVFTLVPGSTQTEAGLVPCGNSKQVGRFSRSDERNGRIPANSDEPEPGESRPLRPNGSDLGFVGAKHDHYSQFSTFSIPKIGIEFDFWDSEGFNRRNDPSNNHVAVVRENSVLHGSTWPTDCPSDFVEPSSSDTASNECTYDWTHRDWPKTNPTCVGIDESTADGVRGCIVGPSTNWLEDRNFDADAGPVEEPYRVRVEARRGCDSSCTTCGDADNGTHMHVKMWIDCTDGNCSDVERDYTAAFDAMPNVRTLDYCALDPGQDAGSPGDFDTVKLGFAVGTGGSNSGIQVTNFVAANTNLPPVITIPPEYQEVDRIPTYDGSTPLAFMAADATAPRGAVTLTDAENDARNSGAGNYDLATIWVRRRQEISSIDRLTGEVVVVDSAPTNDDAFAIDATGKSFGLAGDRIEVGVNQVGSFSQVNGEFFVTFTDANGTVPTTALINEVLQSITFEYSGAGTPAGLVLDIEANDGGGGATARSLSSLVILFDASS